MATPLGVGDCTSSHRPDKRHFGAANHRSGDESAVRTCPERSSARQSTIPIARRRVIAYNLKCCCICCALGMMLSQSSS